MAHAKPTDYAKKKSMAQSISGNFLSRNFASPITIA